MLTKKQALYAEYSGQQGSASARGKIRFLPDPQGLSYVKDEVKQDDAVRTNPVALKSSGPVIPPQINILVDAEAEYIGGGLPVESLTLKVVFNFRNADCVFLHFHLHQSFGFALLLAPATSSLSDIRTNNSFAISRALDSEIPACKPIIRGQDLPANLSPNLQPVIWSAALHPKDSPLRSAHPSKYIRVFIHARL